jgi:(+)-trans-carveol dehydrogenase
MGKLDGQVAFITGVARGQGRSHAVRLAEEGADIVGLDILSQVETVTYPMAEPADLDRTVADVEATGRSIVAVQGDVRDPASIEKVVAAGLERFGRLDIVLANAGISSYGTSLGLSAESWQNVIDINLTGVWNTAKATAPHIINGGRGGSIVITSSAAGLRGMRNLPHYVSAKHGLVGLMKTLALELAPHSIRVNTVHPGAVLTPMIDNEVTRRLFCPDIPEPTAEDFAQRSSTNNLLPTAWTEPIDISNAVLFLVSDEARFITGVALPVDAGYVIR